MTGHGPLEILVCLYTCNRDRHLHQAFYESPVGTYLRQLKNACIYEVFADPDIPASSCVGTQIVLRSPERYETLSLKTLEMMRFCTQDFKFRRLMKIDVGCVRTSFDDPAYQGRAPVDLEQLTRFISGAPPEKDYYGYVLHRKATKANVLSWAKKKGKTVDYDRIFGAEDMPPFYNGLCYFLSSRFARYVADAGEEMARQHVDCLIGAEDVMVGRLFHEFRRLSGCENII